MKRIIYLCLLLLFVACEKENLVINQPVSQVQNENKMGKIINAYNEFTAQQIKDRADVPLQADMTVVGSTVDCSNISVSLIKNVLGVGDTAVSALCSSVNVNKFSGFGPTEWYRSGGLLLSRIKTPYMIGSFAGYNHNAAVAGFVSDLSKPTTFDYTIGANSYTLGVSLQRGEIDWWPLVQATHVKLVIKNNSGVIVGSGLETIAGVFDPQQWTTARATMDISSWSGNMTLTANLYMSNASGQELCLWPNVTEWTITAVQIPEPSVTMKAGNQLIVITGTKNIYKNGDTYNLNITKMQYLNSSYVLTDYSGTINITGYLYSDTDVLLKTWTIATGSMNRTFSGAVGYDVMGTHHAEYIVSNVTNIPGAIY